MRLAAIDLGSNACRLLINDVLPGDRAEPEYIKLVLVRVPLRLGFDVFETGTISEHKIEQLTKTIQSYKLLLDVYEVEDYMACATSAMRDATNAAEVIETVHAATGVRLQVISGDEEASYIYENHVAEGMSGSKSYLYIDVGGGSTELTFFSRERLVFKRSFNIGTIRLLKEKVHEAEWQEMKEYLRQGIKGHPGVICIGSGGNINKVASLAKVKDDRPLSLELIRNYYKELSAYTVAERTNVYKLKEDRADVIVPALLIYLNVMRWAEADEIYVPKIGLSDGLIHHLYEEHFPKKPA